MPMLLHALHAANAGYNAVVITADDTDVLILCLGFSNNIQCSLHKKEERGAAHGSLMLAR